MRQQFQKCKKMKIKNGGCHIPKNGGHDILSKKGEGYRKISSDLFVIFLRGGGIYILEGRVREMYHTKFSRFYSSVDSV